MSATLRLNGLEKKELRTLLQGLGHDANTAVPKEELIQRVKAVAHREVVQKMSAIADMGRDGLAEAASFLGIPGMESATRGDLIMKLVAYYEEETIMSAQKNDDVVSGYQSYGKWVGSKYTVVCHKLIYSDTQPYDTSVQSCQPAGTVIGAMSGGGRRSGGWDVHPGSTGGSKGGSSGGWDVHPGVPGGSKGPQMGKAGKGPGPTHPCLLYTSPSPRDS